MIKKNVGVIGCGKWGKKIIKELEEISIIKFIYNSKDDYKKFDKNIDWIFILTPVNTHYRLAKFFIKKKINVFCEKPLTNKLEQAKDLIKLSRNLDCKMYIDDIENFKKKKIKIYKRLNQVIRTKKDKGSIKSLLNRLAYHDFYLLSKHKDLNKIIFIKIINKKKFLNFKIFFKDKTIFHFYYDINSNIRKHLFNKVSLNNFKNNPIKDMLKTVLYKNIDFKNNNLDAIKCIKLISKIKKLIN